MSILKKVKPEFWDHRNAVLSSFQPDFSFRKKWILLVVFTSIMALLPLFVMSLVELSLTRSIVENEIKAGMQTILETAAVSISRTNDRTTSTQMFVSGFNLGQNENLYVLDIKSGKITLSKNKEGPGPHTFSDMKDLSDNSGVLVSPVPTASQVITAYAKIQDTNFVLVLTRTKKSLTDLWLKPRLQLLGYLICSIIVILLSILGTATYLINRIHSADRVRIEALHHAEHANKIASIGRLASGVAHEVNNPLAIINQKTGLIIDLLEFNKINGGNKNEKLEQLANDIITAVTRCSTITRRLLDFARHMEPSIEKVNMADVVRQMLSFLEKEAQRRNIVLEIVDQSRIDTFDCDKGSLQQIFLNLFENAFAAMENGGRLKILISSKEMDNLSIKVSDTGQGIEPEDLKKIFEPFYSSKNEHWGTGLGLSITYGLIKELGGDIMVKSIVGKGTEFSILLPIKNPKSNNKSTIQETYKKNSTHNSGED